MLVEIENDDHLPAGRYVLNNPDKIARAKQSLPIGSSDRALLIEYDKIGGYIVNVSLAKKVPVHTFWDIEQNKMGDSAANLSDDELLVIIRKGENTSVPGSRYQRAEKEWEIRNQQKILEVAERNEVQKDTETGKIENVRKSWNEKPFGKIALVIFTGLVIAFLTWFFGWN